MFCESEKLFGTKLCGHDQIGVDRSTMGSELPLLPHLIICCARSNSEIESSIKMARLDQRWRGKQQQKSKSMQCLRHITIVTVGDSVGVKQ